MNTKVVISDRVMNPAIHVISIEEGGSITIEGVLRIYPDENGLLITGAPKKLIIEPIAPGAFRVNAH